MGSSRMAYHWSEMIRFQRSVFRRQPRCNKGRAPHLNSHGVRHQSFGMAPELSLQLRHPAPATDSPFQSTPRRRYIQEPRSPPRKSAHSRISFPVTTDQLTSSATRSCQLTRYSTVPTYCQHSSSPPLQSGKLTKENVRSTTTFSTPSKVRRLPAPAPAHSGSSG